MKKAVMEARREAWETLAADPVALAETLLELDAHAESDMVRVRVATAILDRVGLRRGVDVGLSAASLVDICGGSLMQGLVALRWDGCCEASSRTRTTSCDRAYVLAA